MFPLAGKDFPASSDELATAIHDALTDVFTFPKKSAVSVEGGKFPAIKTVSLDLDNAAVTVSKAPPKPVGVGKRKDGITVDKLEISGHPIRYQKAKLELGVTAKGLTFDFDRDKKNHPLLVLTDAKDGKVDARITKGDLQAVLLEAATLAAKEQGVTIQDLQINLQAKGARSVAVEAKVKAKKMLMSGVVNVSGKLDIDDELNATVSDLKCTGEGMIGSAAAGFLQPKIKQYDGTTIPLMTFSLGDVTLRDLKIKVDNSIHVTAAFGSK
jgi:hypothetical protein